MANRIVLKSTNPVTNISAAISTGAQGATGTAGSGGATLADGDAGDITISVGGTVLTVENSAITAAKLASNAVTTAKILDANVTTAKLATGAVTSATTDETFEATLHDAAQLTGTIADARLSTAIPRVAFLAAGGTPVRPDNDATRVVFWIREDAADTIALVASGTAGRYAIDLVFTKE